MSFSLSLAPALILCESSLSANMYMSHSCRSYVKNFVLVHPNMGLACFSFLGIPVSLLSGFESEAGMRPPILRYGIHILRTVTYICTYRNTFFLCTSKESHQKKQSRSTLTPIFYFIINKFPFLSIPAYIRAFSTTLSPLFLILCSRFCEIPRSLQPLFPGA